jgi:hypothetical protein
MSTGKDVSGLGRWIWVRYRGRNGTHLRIFTAYRPTASVNGPFTVYAQHRDYFNATNDPRCPRSAFITDLCNDIKTASEDGDNIVLLIDGNEDMRDGHCIKHSRNASYMKPLCLYMVQTLPPPASPIFKTYQLMVFGATLAFTLRLEVI